MTTSKKVIHDHEQCDTVIELRNELISFKKELRGNFWKKLGLYTSVLMALISSGIGCSAYILDRTSKKFNAQEAIDMELRSRIHDEEKKSVQADMILKQLLELQKESKSDIRDIRSAQHRIELSIANGKETP
jgi:hypothetical protein